jgi:glycosyltransferase involved in cell wall biosynthesis
MIQIQNKQPVVFINQSSGYLMVDIVNAYSEAGYLCVLITGSLVQRNQPLNKKVKVRKIIRYNNNTSLKRIFTWGWGTVQIFLMILFKYHKAHLFIVSNPPFAALLPLILRNSFTLLIFDVYPDAITELGILKRQSPIIRLWTKASQRVFARSKNIFTITEGMKELIRSYAGEKQITVVPLWTDNEFLKPLPDEENSFIKQHKLTGKFVVLYSGNIGLSNDVEVLADVAKLVNMKNIIFVIIGSGARKKQLEDRVKKEGINNFLILPWQDVTCLPFTLSAARLAVVALGKGASKLAIPSKLYSLLSVGVPILGITGQDSDLRQFIEKNEIGRCFLPENKEEIAGFIIHLASHPDLCKIMINNALKTSRFYTNKNVAKFLNPEFRI